MIFPGRVSSSRIYRRKAIAFRSTARVFRGGDFYNSAKSCRSASRDYGVPECVYYRIGLRLVFNE